MHEMSERPVSQATVKGVNGQRWKKQAIHCYCGPI